MQVQSPKLRISHVTVVPGGAHRFAREAALIVTVGEQSVTPADKMGATAWNDFNTNTSSKNGVSGGVTATVPANVQVALPGTGMQPTVEPGGIVTPGQAVPTGIIPDVPNSSEKHWSYTLLTRMQSFAVNDGQVGMVIPAITVNPHSPGVIGI